MFIVLLQRKRIRFTIVVKLEPAAVFRGFIGPMATASNAEGMSRFPVLPPIKSKSPEPQEITASKELLEKHLKHYQALRKHSRKNVERQHLQMSLYDFLFLFMFNNTFLYY